MAVAALRAEWLIPHDVTAVLKGVRAVALGAFEPNVRAVKLEPRIGLVIERQFLETVRYVVAARAIDLLRFAELAQVRVLMA